jgi:hypothetical protein
MKSIFFMMIFILSGCANNTFTYNIKQNDQIKQIEVTKNQNNYLTKNNFSFQNSSYISIQFKDIVPQDITNFETKYGLELKQILIIGDYIYQHNSSDIMNLIENIIQDNPNVQSIKPLWNIPVNIR